MRQLSAFRAIRLLCCFASAAFALCLAGCAGLQNAPVAQETNLHATYVVLGDSGNATARAITTDNHCPTIDIDGVTQSMRVRVAPAVVPRRPTASAPADSKPSSFPVLTCEFPLSATTTRASIAGNALRLPTPNPARIVVIGDTGCRMKSADQAWQGCADEGQWPYRIVANAAAAFKPDLVIHLGDYHYRENACPESIAGCRGSPWGYGWDTWQADLFVPARALLAAAPWIVIRGNHEECRRAGQGWFRFLDPAPYRASRNCDRPQDDVDGDYSDPYAVAIGPGWQAIVFDSARAGYTPLDPAKSADAYAFEKYQQQFRAVDTLAAKGGAKSLFINHHPILGFSTDPKFGVQGGQASLISVMKTLNPARLYPSSVTLALHGHIHLFEAISFASDHPATLVSGNAGDEVYINLPERLNADKLLPDGVVLESITHGNFFGFALMEKRTQGWQIRAYDQYSQLRATCDLVDNKLRCDRTGLIK